LTGLRLADKVRGARSASHAERFKRAAHSLKSNSQTLGAMALGQMARALELAGRTLMNRRTPPRSMRSTRRLRRPPAH